MEGRERSRRGRDGDWRHKSWGADLVCLGRTEDPGWGAKEESVGTWRWADGSSDSVSSHVGVETGMEVVWVWRHFLIDHEVSFSASL